ncbi:hypothetical protein GCM10023351_06220 [Microbacterium gilvum]|uniref:DUF559 domain-containing protein n=1 Tax=Microbacterium gilvum TaxID=1336204 RepID=A0ABP8ZVR5_9MICO
MHRRRSSARRLVPLWMARRGRPDAARVDGMSRRPDPLPARVAGRAFRARDVPEASPARLRASDLWIPAQGIRLPVARRDVVSVCRAILLTLPSCAVFSHGTAAQLAPLPVPRRITAEDRVHVTTPVGVRARRGRRIRGHERALHPDEVVERSGLPVTSPARTFCDLAEDLTLAELVAVGDAAARIVGAEAIRRAVERVPARRRSAVLRRALELLDPASESPKESELRVLLITSGFGPFRCNVEVRDGEGGFVARVDLAIVGLKIAIEYEGDHHRDKAQWRRDQARRRRLEALGWIYIPVTQADLDDPRRLLNDLRVAVELRS